MSILKIVAFAGAGLTLLSVVVNVATGSRGFTRYHSEEIAAVNAEDDFGALFEEEAGDVADSGEDIANSFALGWLPSGPGRDSLSVASVAGLSFAAFAGVFAYQRFKGRSGKKGEG